MKSWQSDFMNALRDTFDVEWEILMNIIWVVALLFSRDNHKRKEKEYYKVLDPSVQMDLNVLVQKPYFEVVDGHVQRIRYERYDGVLIVMGEAEWTQPDLARNLGIDKSNYERIGRWCMGLSCYWAHTDNMLHYFVTEKIEGKKVSYPYYAAPLFMTKGIPICVAQSCTSVLIGPLKRVLNCAIEADKVRRNTSGKGPTKQTFMDFADRAFVKISELIDNQHFIEVMSRQAQINRLIDITLTDPSYRWVMPCIDHPFHSLENLSIRQWYFLVFCAGLGFSDMAIIKEHFEGIVTIGELMDLTKADEVEMLERMAIKKWPSQTENATDTMLISQGFGSQNGNGVVMRMGLPEAVAESFTKLQTFYTEAVMENKYLGTFTAAQLEQLNDSKQVSHEKHQETRKNILFEMEKRKEPQVDLGNFLYKGEAIDLRRFIGSLIHAHAGGRLDHCLLKMGPVGIGSLYAHIQMEPQLMLVPECKMIVEEIKKLVGTGPEVQQPARREEGEASGEPVAKRTRLSSATPM